MYGAYSKEELIRVISISSSNNISCVFVDKNYHREGIATALFTHITSELEKKHVEKISLNASPYAVPFYHSIGSKDLDCEQNFHGIFSLHYRGSEAAMLKERFKSSSRK